MTSCKRDPETGLTPQQERFCLGLAKGMSQAAAYREAYPRSVNWKPQILYQKASELAANGKIQRRVAGLQADLRVRSGYDLMQAMRESGEALQLAFEQRNPAAVVAAVTLRARMNGLLVEDRTNTRRPYQHMSEAELTAAIEKAEAEIAESSRLL